MANTPVLTEAQKTRLSILEPALKEAVYTANYKRAKVIATDIQELLRATGHETRLMRSKNWLFEAALNAGEIHIAEAGFRGVRAKTAPNTKIHLEATALLAVCLLRQKKISDAEPFIAKVLQSKNIRDPEKRREFVQNIIVRYQLESYITAIKDLCFENLNVDAIDTEAIEAVKTKTEEELYSQIGEALPREVIEFVFRVDKTSRKQLSVAEILYLPSPAILERKMEQGKNFFASLKLIIWKAICDPQSEIYKAWYTNGISQVLSKKYYAFIVTSALVDLGFAVKAIAVSVTAILMKLGLEVYCERYRPGEILDGRP
jgi:hypothetical protein